MASNLHTDVHNHYHYDHPIVNALAASHLQFLNPVPYAALIHHLLHIHYYQPGPLHHGVIPPLTTITVIKQCDSHILTFLEKYISVNNRVPIATPR